MEYIIDIEEWYNNLFDKPQFNWFCKNDTFFDDIKLWKKNKKELITYFS